MISRLPLRVRYLKFILRKLHNILNLDIIGHECQVGTIYRQITHSQVYIDQQNCCFTILFWPLQSIAKFVPCNSFRWQSIFSMRGSCYSEYSLSCLVALQNGLMIRRNKKYECCWNTFYNLTKSELLNFDSLDIRWSI